jgi:hypothetical protein
MAIADPLSRLSRQEHRVDNLDLPLLLEMLLSELPEEIRKLERFCVNTEKDTNVATRMVQRWRSLNNPISNTIGGTEGTDFLIAAPYANKLPIKVASYIRKDVPFAILIPLSLLIQIERVGKSEVDNHIREKRSRMKLIISSSLGQAWLINHPICRLETSTHSVFFTEITDNEPLQRATCAMFSSWYTENVESTDENFSSTDMPSHDLDLLVVNAIDRPMTGGVSHEHDAFANLTPRELRAKRRESNRQVTPDQSKGQDDSTATFSDQSENEEESNSDFSSPPEEISTECQRTLNQPLHTISTALPPLPTERWAPLQDPEDISSNMM